MERHLGFSCVWALCGAVAASAAVVQTAADGSTFDVADGVLTANVPAGVTNGYDYVANILDVPTYGITSVVKTGSGTLNAPAAPNYTGSWRVDQGVVAWKDATSFGPANSANRSSVTVESGAAIIPAVAGKAALSDRALALAGSGTTDVKGVISNPVGGWMDIARSQITLEDDATIWSSSSGGARLNTSWIDLNGHALSLAGVDWSWAYIQENTVVTNSSVTPARMVLEASSNFKTSLGASKWLGGSANVIDVTGLGRLYLNGRSEGDWTLRLKGPVRGEVSTAPQTENRFGWFGPGPVVINGVVTIGNADNQANGHGLVLAGPVSGDASSKIAVERGAWVAFAGSCANYDGEFELKGQGDATYRCTACFRKDASFLTRVDKTVKIADSDIWMDAETVRQLPTLSITSGKSTITGSAAGSTIAAITVAGGAVNTLDTPATVGTYTLTKGTLAIGTAVPTIEKLVCVDGVIDLNGRNLSVRCLTGQPQVKNGGTITLDSLSLDAAQPAPACAAEFRFADGATFEVKSAGGDVPAGVYEVLHLAPGAELPDLAKFTASVPAGFTAAFAARPVTAGERVGWTAVVLTVSPDEIPAAVSWTDVDGTRFEAGNRILTITVPEGVTNAYDYADLVRTHFVTNIVKTGVGGLSAPPVADYTGDFTIATGQLLVNAIADLGRERMGCVRVREGAALTVQESAPDYCIRGATIELAGAGPDGLGAMRGAANRIVTITGNVYRLTADAKWLNNGSRFDIRGSFLDVAGHVLSLRNKMGSSWSQMGYFYNCTVTNSVFGSKGGVQVVTDVGMTSPKFQLDGPSAWWGGPLNEIDYSLRSYIGKTDGDWTLPLKGNEVWGANGAADTSVSNANYWAGTVRVDSNSTIGNNEGIRTNQWTKESRPYPFAVHGPIHGAKERTLTLDTAFHLFSKENDFAGKVIVTSASINNALNSKLLTRYFRNGLWLHDGAVFSCGAEYPVEFMDADLWFADGTPLAMPALKHVSGDCWITGGARGDGAVPRPVVASIEKTQDGLLAIESSVVVTGVLSVAKGTLALGTNGLGAARSAAELPVLSNLVFVAGTAFNMNGSALTVPNFTGRPAVTNAGALTIGASLLVDSADSALETTSSVSFAPGAVIKVPATFSPLAGRPFEVCVADGGVLGDLPTVDDPRARPWRVEKSADGTSLLLTRVQDGTLMIFR